MAMLGDFGKGLSPAAMRAPALQEGLLAIGITEMRDTMIYENILIYLYRYAHMWYVTITVHI